MESWCDKPRYTIDYAPPELLQHTEFGTYSEALDIWCLGATLFTMYMGHSPFRQGREDRQVSSDTMKQRILNDEIYTDSIHWQRASPELQDLIRGCMEKEVAKRFTLNQILQHPWFQVVLEQEAVASIKSEQLVDDSVEVDNKDNISTVLHEECLIENPAEDENIANLPLTPEYTEIEIGPVDNVENVDIVDEFKQPNISENTDIATEEVLMQYSLQSEGDARSSLGRSKSSDEKMVEATDLQEVDLNTELEQIELKIEPDMLIIAEQNDTEDILSDQEDFEGFDENMPPIHSWLISHKFIIFDKTPRTGGRRGNSRNVAKKSSAIKPQQGSSSSVERKTKRSSNAPPQTTRRSGRIVSIVRKSCDSSLAKAKTKMATKSSVTPATQRKLQRASEISKRQSNQKQKLQSVSPAPIDDYFIGFDDQERKLFAQKTKYRWRLFCSTLHNTQVSLKHFNIERRVYNRTKDDSEAVRTGKARINIAQKPADVAPPQSLAKVNKEVLAVGRRQPSRFARAQRARYVFE